MLFTDNAIETKMMQIQNIKDSYVVELREANKGLMDLASEFDSYYELYMFVKNATVSIEEFNSAMYMGRPIFLNKS